MRLGVLASHPVQYYTPLFRALAQEADLHVFYAHQQTAHQQAEAGFGVAFDWDTDLLGGYRHTFLENVAARPTVATGQFFGCDTPGIYRHVRQGSFDAFVVIGWYLKCFWQAVAACRGAGAPVLARGDSQLRTPTTLARRMAKEVLYRIVLRAFDGFLTVGQRFRAYLRYYGIPNARLFDAPHCVDNAAFARRAEAARASGEAQQLRRRLTGGEASVPVLLFVGKFTENKRPQDVIRALAILPEGERPRAVFVGSGALEDAVKAEADQRGVRAVFAGFQNQTDLPAYYAAADAVVLPSASETWGLVVNEAMACGLPALVSEACGCAPDLIDAGRTGYTFPVGDASALARRIRQWQAQHARGHDFRPALQSTMRSYSIDAAVRGTLRAAETLSSR